MRERQRVEWKGSRRDELLKAICGFANADGGILVASRNDSGKVAGRFLPEATRRELAARVGLSPDGVKYQLQRLTAAGRLRHVGPRKSGHWEVS